MKHIISVFLLIAAFLTGCETKEVKNIENSVNFYYLRQSNTYGAVDSVFLAEARELSNVDLEPSVLLKHYLEGPQSTELVSPFPDKLQLVSFSVEDQRAYITLSNELTELDNFSRTLACACITKTILEITNVNSVEICVEIGAIQDDSLFITMDSKSLLLFDSATVTNENKK